MTEYRYYSIEPVSGAPVVELPLYGTFMDKQLNGPGNFVGTYRIGVEFIQDAALLDGTIPGRHGIVCKRDNIPIWAGMLWSRTYNTQAKTVQLTGQTFESLFPRIMLVADFINVGVEQVTIFTNLINQIQAQLAGAQNFGFVMSPVLAATGVTRNVNIPAFANQMAQDAINKLIDLSDGLNYTVNIVDSATPDTITKQIALSAANAPASSTLYYDFPGTISQYWYTERGIPYRHVAKGAGPLIASVDSAGMTGWPLLHEVRQYTDIQDQAVLNSRANGDAVLRKPPMPTPIFELGSQSMFTGWDDLGKTFSVRIQDDRFPAGKVITSKLRGWSLNPESSNEAEVIRLELEDDV